MSVTLPLCMIITTWRVEHSDGGTKKIFGGLGKLKGVIIRNNDVMICSNCKLQHLALQHEPEAFWNCARVLYTVHCTVAALYRGHHVVGANKRCSLCSTGGTEVPHIEVRDNYFHFHLSLS